MYLPYPGADQENFKRGAEKINGEGAISSRTTRKNVGRNICLTKLRKMKVPRRPLAKFAHSIQQEQEKFSLVNMYQTSSFMAFGLKMNF